MKSRHGELLLELAALIERYPSSEWIKLARMIEDERSRAKIVAFLQGLSNLRETIYAFDAVPQRINKGKLKPAGVEKLKEVENLEREIAQLPTRDLKEFATRFGLRVSRKDSRKRLVDRIVRNSKVRRQPAKKKGLTPPAVRKSNDYENWARIILGKSDKNTEEK
jgi:hypothetical protein